MVEQIKLKMNRAERRKIKRMDLSNSKDKRIIHQGKLQRIAQMKNKSGVSSFKQGLFIALIICFVLLLLTK
jgi:hypothetical protein